MKALVIAEKPSVARDIARVLKCGKNINGAIEGERYVVTWGLGHLVELADPESYAAAREGVHPLQVFQQVEEDNIFVTEEQWERINGKAVVNTETVDSVSDTLTNASLKLNGVSDGMISYNRVV